MYLQKNVKVTIVLITCVTLENGSFSVRQKKRKNEKNNKKEFDTET